MTHKVATLSPLHQKSIDIHKNQNLIITNKVEHDNNFLQIGNEEWMCAARNLKPVTTLLYFYLAKDMDGYQKALSYIAVKNAIGISKSGYHNAFNELMEKGYLVKCGTKERLGYETYNFYTTPHGE